MGALLLYGLRKGRLEPVDYVEWVQRVMQAILAAWNAADEDTRYMGVDLQRTVDALGLSADTHAPDFEVSKLAEAVGDALRDLERIGWVDQISQGAGIYRPTLEGRRLASVDPSEVWDSIISQTPLDDDQLAFLRGLNALGEEKFTDYVCVKDITAREVFETVAWPWEDAKAYRLADELGRLGLLHESVVAMGGNISLIPSYAGIVRTSRQVESEWGKLLAELASDWENTNVEFVRELSLKTDREKGEFLRDILALATTLTSGRRLYIIGFDDETRDFHKSVDDSIDQERLEAILAAYTHPMPQVRYLRVPYKGGIAGVVEIYQDKSHLPYRVSKDIWKLKVGDVRVRHGSLSEPPTDDECSAIDAEGRRARGQV